MPGTDDVAYVPDLEQPWAELGPRIETCLVLGEPPQTLLDRAANADVEVRLGDGARWSVVLPRGAYTLRIDGRCVVLVVLHGLPAIAPTSGQVRFVEGPVGTARPVFQAEVASSKPAMTSAGVSEGDLVQVTSTGSLGKVVSVRAMQGKFAVVVDGRHGRQTMDVSAVQVVDGDPDDPAFWVTQPPASAEDLALTISWTKLRHPLTDTVYSYKSTKTVFRAYQFAPVLKILGESGGRLLVADEVGLGKTIEAGLIWTELQQRRAVDRVLVVAPAALLMKWKAEMARRFDLDLQVLRPAELLEHAKQMRAGRDVRFSGVVSVESLRTADAALSALIEVHAHLDLVIVDEAHVLRNRGTRSHDLGQLLSDWSDVLVFLSATPLNLGQSDLFNLVNLLKEEEFADEAVFEAQLEPNAALTSVVSRVLQERDRPRALLARVRSIEQMELGEAVTARPAYTDLCRLLDQDRPLGLEEVAQVRRAAIALNTLGSVLTRTRKIDTPDAKAKRSAEQVDVAWTERERKMYDTIQAIYMAEYSRSGVPPGFAMQMPLRQAASCLPAMQQVLRQRRFSLADDYEERDLDDDPGDLGEAESSAFLDMPTLLAELPVDSKYEAMEDKLLALRDAGLRQVMIFSYFRRTISYLEQRLGHRFTVRSMHGGTPMEERQPVMQAFRDGELEVLILSQVGAEGLDFEFCNVMVNYDLPWNPMQVEQRIGRLDRFGQQHERLFIYNMHVPGTIESDIFQRLYERIGVFERSIGELEPILRDELRSVTRSLLDPRLSEDERRQETERVAVALADRAERLRELESARGVLSTIDQLEVDGMTDDGPREGRFVGASEVHRLVGRLVERHGGSLTEPNQRTGVSRLSGSDDLAQVVRRSGVSGTGRMRSVAQLAAQLRDGTPLRVTFDGDRASKQQIELVSARHPLTEVAVRDLEEAAGALARFGVVTVRGLDLPPAGCLLQLDLVRSTGLTPRVELWATAVALDSGREVDHVGGAVLEAVAHGLLLDVDAPLSRRLPALLRDLEQVVFARRAETERRWRAENEARVDARIASRLRSIELKLGRATATLAEVVALGRDDRVRRLHEGRIKNLEGDRDEVGARLDADRALHVSTTTVALLQVNPGDS